jgi:hypothetical protein
MRSPKATEGEERARAEKMHVYGERGRVAAECKRPQSLMTHGVQREEQQARCCVRTVANQMERSLGDAASV